NSTVCGAIGEGGNLVMNAPFGSVFSSVAFASYGTPNGSCSNFSIGSCHALNSQSIVEGFLLGNSSATIPASNSVFGDPCGGTYKRLYVQATIQSSSTPVSIDIDKTIRSNPPDLGAKEFSICSNDAGVHEFWGLANPLPVGVNPIRVVLQNHGSNNLTSTTIFWSVNGVAQTPYSWTGNLSPAQNTVVNIGTFPFASGSTFKLKGWTGSVNGSADCDNYNDTCSAIELATPLCGVYTIGGVNPDFNTFTTAAAALNAAGVACPVVFRVRNGSYNEQIKLFEINGSSVANFIIFEGENGDSSLAELHYQASNPSNDFTLSLTGTDYITFRKMGIRRTNGTGNLIIQSGSHDVTAENCRLGNVTSPNTSCDSVLTFRYNNMTGFDLNLLHPDAGPLAGRIIVEGNYLNSLNITNSRNVSVRNNRNTIDVLSYAVDFTINRSKYINVESNRMRGVYFDTDTSFTVLSNNIYRNEYSNGETYGVYMNASRWGEVGLNTIVNDRYYPCCSPSARGVSIRSTTDVVVYSNTISVSTNTSNSQGVQVLGVSSKRLTIKNNSISNGGGGNRYGIYISNGDSLFVKNNSLNGLDFSTSGYGISLYNVPLCIEVDSNSITNFLNEGIHSMPTTGSSWKIRYNNISNIQDAGIYAEGAGAAKYIGNRITGMKAGKGIVVNGPNALVANNYIHAEGLGIAKGISLQTLGTGSRIYHNNVSITGVDVVNGQALEVLGGTGYIIRNNIFSNTGGGYAAYLNASVSTFDMDYNDYYSAKRKLFYYAGTLYDTLSVFANATGKDLNGKEVNPYYISTTDLAPNIPCSMARE
ncbi:MAG: right-handed parallel beta-helix repeat-containing protein, partial [Bacteroidota bacterium]